MYKTNEAFPLTIFEKGDRVRINSAGHDQCGAYGVVISANTVEVLIETTNAQILAMQDQIEAA